MSATPFGFHCLAGGLVVEPDEAKVVLEAVRLYLEAGASARKVSDALNAKGHATRAGVAWTGPTVSRVLRDPAIAGGRTRNGRRFWGDHTAIVSRAVFERVRALRRRNGFRLGGTVVEEQARILAALAIAGGNRTAAARNLGISRQGFYAKLHRLRMTDREGAPGTVDEVEASQSQSRAEA